MLYLALTEPNAPHVFQAMCFPKAVGVFFPFADFVEKKSTDHNNRLFCVSFPVGTCYLSRLLNIMELFLH